jgi:hypothetical protein
VAKWKALVGRISLFPVVSLQSSQPSVLDVYREIWGGDPESFQKADNPLAPSVAHGRRGGLVAGCVVQQSRIDLNLMASPSPPGFAQPSFPLIDDTTPVRAELLRIADVIGQGPVPDVTRVAVHLQFVKLTGTFVEANRELMAVIPKKYGFSITDEEDFIFQINRPHASRDVQGVKMNSLTKWSADRIQIVSVSLPASTVAGPAMPGAAKVNPQTKEFIAASVLLDNNNLPAPTPLSGRDQSLLLRESIAATEEMREDVGISLGGDQIE